MSDNKSLSHSISSGKRSSRKKSNSVSHGEKSSRKSRSPQVQRRYQKIIPKSKKLFVTNIDSKTSQAELKKELSTQFGKFGQIKQIIMKTKPGSSNSFVFIEFNEIQEAAKALQGMRGKDFKGKQLKVQFGKGQKRYDQSAFCGFCHKAGHSTKDCRSRKKFRRSYSRDRSHDRNDRRRNDYQRSHHRDRYRDDRQRQSSRHYHQLDRRRDRDRYYEKENSKYRRNSRSRSRSDSYHDRRKRSRSPNRRYGPRHN